MSSPADSAAHLSRSAARVQDALAAAGLTVRVVELPASTRTAAEAALAIGCEVAQIAKSLIFRGAVSDTPILVIASGTNRVDESLLAQAAGEPIRKADAEFVRTRVGFAIGGPLSELNQLRLSRDLLTDLGTRHR